MNQTTDRLVRRFLEGDLDTGEEARALHRIAEDEEARALLRFDSELRTRLGAGRARQAPPDFASRTMAAIAAEEEAAEPAQSQAALGEQLAEWWNRITRPRPVLLRPVYGLAAAAVVLIVLIGIWPVPREASDPSEQAVTVQQAAAPGTESSPDGVVGVRFMYLADEASSVAVAGDFSGWEPVPLESRMVDGERVWTSVIPLPKGEHQYMFVVDGEDWVTDPLAPVQRSDGFGNRNAVISI